MSKPKTKWFPANRHGLAQVAANYKLVDNLGNYLVDNLVAHNNLVTTPLQITSQPRTAWSAS